MKVPIMTFCKYATCSKIENQRKYAAHDLHARDVYWQDSGILEKNTLLQNLCTYVYVIIPHTLQYIAHTAIFTFSNGQSHINIYKISHKIERNEILCSVLCLIRIFRLNIRIRLLYMVFKEFTQQLQCAV